MAERTGPEVHGRVVNDVTGCVHYSSPADIVAIRFWCCDRFYPCLHCHREDSDHPIAPWPAEQRGAEAVLCGVCGRLLTIDEYRDAQECPGCASAFNPGCSLHWDVYFG
ncbi:CHY zinc finger protein [Brevibacterium daeguense]|uniref:CHY zinc finger protein n=1 Tax=Brevibacterium daeguense TaxID=909936 RepID=A0ABP8EFX6_9MICO